MVLNNDTITKEAAQWEAAGYALPQYDREQVRKATAENPFWIHFGAGNIFRAFHTNIVERLLNRGVLERGIIVAEGFDYEIVEKVDRRCDELTILATLKVSGKVEKSVIGSITESCILDSNRDDEFNRLKEIFRKESLQMATFTITEKGYSLTNAQGEMLPWVVADFAEGPAKPQSYLGKVTALLYERFLAGELPIAMISTDNCSHNGDKLYQSVKAYANAWCENGFVDRAFVEYIECDKKVSFPWTMIDKITPRPDGSVLEMLKKDGLEGIDPIITGKNTYVAPFVNAEECEYLVVEDKFPNGRPALEKAGVMFTDRETVNNVEKMKVCTCLNPLHTALAVYGCLLNYTLIADEMRDEQLLKMVQTIGYKEGLPVVVNPGILDPKEFIDTVLNVRVPNPFMPDTPQRIATDTSQKLAIRFGETIKAYQASPELEVSDLKLIPLVFAGWLRYLMAIDDRGEKFTLSPDPLLEEVCPYVAGFSLGYTGDVESALEPILRNKKIFGVDLYEVGLAKQVCQYFSELIAGVGAVRETLKKYTK